ncbi:hypothetical protein [uncultured Selenomonas sp.]|uniref:O-linked N-acetylglucosamine transferase, SPINDLY family protein n=1 Tax=uncultured Selenomonas sp. TaxID=159275 RepID=UPI0025CE2849|nr:hypothetical protein [uncultured Selenomonas sp.]
MDDVQALRQEILLRANDLYEKREYARVAEVAQELLTVLPEDVEMRYILAAALTQTGAYGAARAEVARIRAVCPDHAGAARQEVYIDRAEGKLATEIAHLRALIEMLKRRMAEEEERHAHDAVFLASAYSLLGAALTEAGEAQEAVAAFLASAQLETGRAQQAVEYSNALFAVNYLPTYLRPLYAGLAYGYDALFADVLPRAGAADATRGHARIRIGYISPDLCVHPVGRLVRPLLTQYDRTQFAVHCYARCAEDALSETFRAAVDVWHNIRGCSAAEAAALIRRDEVDILVDLAGHTQGNSLPVLAFRPAPVQVTGIGYFNTTGLSAVDYMLSDVYVDPPGAGDDAMTEEIIRLPHSHFCYPLPDDLPPVMPPPMEQRGCVTFGSFNNFNKVTDEVLCLWRQVLDAVPGARLLVKSKIFDHGEGRTMVAERLARCGIPAARVEMRGFSRGYLREYGDVDIALDPFPYTGGITTCEALSMGVPVVTLAGESHGARFGASLLTNAHLPELVAQTPVDYVRIAAGLAAAPDTLRALRRNLRTMLRHAPLTDAAGYVHDVEDVYRSIWAKFVRAAGTA